MPPSKNNAKKESGRAKKAENEEKKAQAANAAKEAKEAESWKDGAKGSSKAEAAAAKQAELARKKAEREALLAAEEASTTTKKAAPKAGQKKKQEKTLPPGGIIASSYSTNDPLGLRAPKDADVEREKVVELSATGIEGMLEVMDLINEPTSKEAQGAKAGLIERHPERRFKAAFEAYLEREMPRIRDDHPGLRQNQYRDRLFKEFEKSPENPFNQAKVAYNATKDEKVEALRKVTEAREAKYKVEEQ